MATRRDRRAPRRHASRRPPRRPRPSPRRSTTLLAGMRTGTILDRSGKPYKPSTCRSYAAGRSTVTSCPSWATLRLSSVTRREVQDLVDVLWQRGLAPSTIHNKLDPLRVIFRRAIRRDEPAVAIDRPTASSCRPCAASATGSRRPPRPRKLIAAVARGRPRLLDRRPLLRPPPRRAARAALARDRLRGRRHPRRARVGRRGRRDRAEDRRRAARGADGWSRPHGARRAQAPQPAATATISSSAGRRPCRSSRAPFGAAPSRRGRQPGSNRSPRTRRATPARLPDRRGPEPEAASDVHRPQRHQDDVQRLRAPAARR